MHQDEQHPIVAGLAALVVVAIVIGVVGGIAMLVGTRAAGLGGSDSGKSASAGASLYAPNPSPTKVAAASSIKLLPTISATGTATISNGDTTESATPTTAPTPTSTPTPVKSQQPAPDKRITLQADEPQARPMQMVGISGIYPGGEGAILRLERNEGSGWKTFGIPDVDVIGEQFSTKIQTGHTGQQQFRMRDVDSGKVSNVVTVTIG